MMRDSPCDEPCAWGGEYRSKQTTSAPRVASLQAVAAPMTPPPTTATFISVRRDARDRLPGNDEVADVQQQGLDRAGDGGGNLRVHLVGVGFHQRLALGDVLTFLLAPGADRDLLGALQV